MSHRMRNIATVFMVVMMAVAAFAAGFLANDFARGVRAEDRTTVSAEEFGVFWEAWDRVQETFIDELPASNEVVYGAIRGSLRELNDPYTVFIEPVAREQERVRLQGTFGGIGANVFRDENGNVVLEPIAGNPAEAAGVLSGDILIAVDGEPVSADATVEQIVQMVRGEVGTPVVITVLHPDSAESVDLEVIRAVILLPSVDYRLLEADPTVGLYNWHAFGRKRYRSRCCPHGLDGARGRQIHPRFAVQRRRTARRLRSRCRSLSGRSAGLLPAHARKWGTDSANQCRDTGS